MGESNYRLDRSKFKMQSFQEADNQSKYWKTKTVEERLKAAWYLISVAFKFNLKDPPRLDKTAFSMRKHPCNG